MKIISHSIILVVQFLGTIIVQNKQQAMQKAKSENTEARAKSLEKVNNDIDKSKEKDILKQGQKIADKLKEQTKANSTDKIRLESAAKQFKKQANQSARTI
ncbi:MAG: hypothetical protein RCO49_02695 [Rickettsia endosymbiont of Argas persicus]